MKFDARKYGSFYYEREGKREECEWEREDDKNTIVRSSNDHKKYYKTRFTIIRGVKHDKAWSFYC